MRKKSLSAKPCIYSVIPGMELGLRELMDLLPYSLGISESTRGRAEIFTDKENKISLPIRGSFITLCHKGIYNSRSLARYLHA